MTDQDRSARCKLCGGEAFHRFSLALAGDMRGDYFECKNCALLQSYHLDNVSKEDMQALYEIAKRTDLDPGAAWRVSYVARRLEQLAKLRVLRSSERFKMLDFGSGSGFLVGYLAHRLGWDTWGYDPYVDPAFAMERTLRDWDAVVSHGPYHLVVASEVFEHFIQPRVEIVPLGSILADEASLFITTGLYIPGGRGPEWSYLAPQTGHHVAFYARRSLEEVARLLGLAAVYQVGDEYEWLLTRRGQESNARRLRLSTASTALTLGVRCGVLARAE